MSIFPSATRSYRKVFEQSPESTRNRERLKNAADRQYSPPVGHNFKFSLVLLNRFEDDFFFLGCHP